MRFIIIDLFRNGEPFDIVRLPLRNARDTLRAKTHLRRRGLDEASIWEGRPGSTARLTGKTLKAK